MLTIKPHGKNGHLSVVDDNGKKVGTGRMKPSKTVPGYCTVSVNVTKRPSSPMSESFKNSFSVFRVPINWIEALDEQTN